jgi:hypothetical protein
MRVRSAAPAVPGSQAEVSELVRRFEGLPLAAARWRPELEPAGRQFVDRILELEDGLVAALTAGEIARTPPISETWGDGWVQLEARDADLSVGGMGIEVGGPPPPLGAIDIEFLLPADVAAAPFHLTGRVIHVRGAGPGRSWFGVQWDDLPSRTAERLVRVLGDAPPAHREGT